MSLVIEFADETPLYQARIKVIGVGGSGGNAVNTMIHFGVQGVEFISVNTDIQALNANAASIRVNIGSCTTRGLGAGADPALGHKAALEDVAHLKEVVSGADMVFVAAGMGGGTGTGAAPIVAQLAREQGALTVGVVTKPFQFEGRRRARLAEKGITTLAEHVDTLITIPNEKLLSMGDDDLTMIEAFQKADEVLYQAVRGISDLIMLDGVVNVDFADVRTIMSSKGRALMGTGMARGHGRTRLAAQQAIASPLLDDISVHGATAVLINVVGDHDIRLKEIGEAVSLVQEQAHQEANIIFGASIDEEIGDAVKVTVIAAGFQQGEAAPQTNQSLTIRRSNGRGEVVREVPTPTARTALPDRIEPALVPAWRKRCTVPFLEEDARSSRSMSAHDSSSVGEMGFDWDSPSYLRKRKS